MQKEEYDLCLRCHRKLKNPEYRKVGYGKICFAKIQQVNQSKMMPLFNKIEDKYNADNSTRIP